MIADFFAKWGIKLLLSVIISAVIGGTGYWGKQRYDESKREEGRQEVRAEWDTANEVARLAARNFELRAGSNNRKLDDARHAELKRLRVVVSDQQKALNETIDLLNARNVIAPPAERVSVAPDEAGNSCVPEPRPTSSCVDEVARLGDIAIRNYEAATSCADQVNKLQEWIITNQELYELMETR